MHDIFIELLNEQLQFRSLHSCKQSDALPEVQNAKLNKVLKELCTVYSRLGADSKDERGGTVE